MGLYPLLASLVLTMTTVVSMTASTHENINTIPIDSFDICFHRVVISVGTYITSFFFLPKTKEAFTPINSCSFYSCIVYL
jgi:hypothetical protein